MANFCSSISEYFFQTKTDDNYLLFFPANSANHIRIPTSQNDLQQHIETILGGGPIINIALSQKNSGLAAFCGLQHSSKTKNSLAFKYLDPQTPVVGDVVVVGKKENGIDLRTLSDIDGECDLIATRRK